MVEGVLAFQMHAGSAYIRDCSYYLKDLIDWSAVASLHEGPPLPVVYI